MSFFHYCIIFLSLKANLLVECSKIENFRAKYHFSETYGGMSWSFVDYPFSFSPRMSARAKVKSIYITHTLERLISMKLILSDFSLDEEEDTWFYSSSVGDSNYAGLKSVWHVPPGELITMVILRHGSDIDSIQFVTDKGSRSSKYGGNGGQQQFVSLRGSLVGVSGKSSRSGDVLRQIQFTSMEIVYLHRGDDQHLAFSLENAHSSWINKLVSLNELVVSGSLDGKIKIWNMSEGHARLKYTFDFWTGGHKFWIKELIAFDKHNLLASIAEETRTIKIWETKKGNLKYSLNDHTSSVHALASLGEHFLGIKNK